MERRRQIVERAVVLLYHAAHTIRPRRCDLQGKAQDLLYLLLCVRRQHPVCYGAHHFMSLVFPRKSAGACEENGKQPPYRCSTYHRGSLPSPSSSVGRISRRRNPPFGPRENW